MEVLVGAFNQDKALVGAFSVIVQSVVSRLDDPEEYQQLLAALHYANHDEVEGDSSFYVSSPGTCQGDQQQGL